MSGAYRVAGFDGVSAAVSGVERPSGVAAEAVPIGLVIVLPAFIVLLFVALASIKKRTLRFRPRRVTHVARGTAETCVWLQRLVDALFSPLCETYGRPACDRLFQTLTALVEDGGYAANTKLRVDSFGCSAPRVVAVSAVQGSSRLAMSVECELAYGCRCAGANCASPSTGTRSVGADGVAATTTGENAESDAQSHSLAVSWSGDVPIARGRSLPVSVSLSGLSFVAHCRLHLTVVEGEAPAVAVTVSLMSEPVLSVTMNTTLGAAFKLRDWFGFVIGARLLAVARVRKMLLHPQEMRFVVPLPRSGGNFVTADDSSAND